MEWLHLLIFSHYLPKRTVFPRACTLYIKYTNPKNVIYWVLQPSILRPISALLIQFCDHTAMTSALKQSQSLHAFRQQMPSFWALHHYRELNLWPIIGCRIDATDDSHRRIPTPPFACVRTRHPIWSHLVRCKSQSSKNYLFRPTPFFQEQVSALGQAILTTTFCTSKVQTHPEVITLSFRWSRGTWIV